MTLLVQNARVLTLDHQGTEYDCADILVDDQVITAVGNDIPIPKKDAELKIIDGRGLLAMPGLINGHLHSPGNLMRGMLNGLPLEVFMLYEVPPLSHEPASPKLTYSRTLLGCLEMLKLGITAVHDDAYYVPYPTPDTIDALMQAYADSGMRAIATIDQPNVVEYDKYPYLKDLLPPNIQQEMANAPRQSPAELLDLYTHLIQNWNGAAQGRLGAAVSCSAPQRVTVDYFTALSDLSQRHGLPFDVHILETKLQRLLGQEKYGKSLVRYVHDLGLLNERMLVIHAIWTDEADWELLAEAGCTVAHNPVCNLRLGSGVMPFRALRDRHIPICLGTDEASVDDTLNLWGVMKTTGLIHTLSDPDYRHWPQSLEILKAAIHGGARGMGLHDTVGCIAPGYQADIILLDLNTLAFTPLNDLHRQLVFCENGSSVVSTIVAGQVVVDRGKVLTIDEEGLKAEVRDIMDHYRQELSGADAAAQRLEPYYREMYLKAAFQDIGMNRWVG